MTRFTRTLILTQADVERLVTMRQAIRAVAEAFKAHARGDATMPPKLYLNLPHHGDFRAMPSAFRRPAICGIKWVNVHPGNPARRLPTVMGTVILNDATTGFPLAILDGLSVTRVRTGAAAAVAANALAVPRATRAALVGCGAQAWPQLAGLLAVRRLRDVRVWGYRPGEAAQFCRRIQPRVSARLMPALSVQACVEAADVIVTITSSRRPLVMRGWVTPGAHINAIGADAPGKQELDPGLLRASRVVVDDPAQAIHGGELNVAVAQGQVSRRVIQATLGEVLLRRRPGRTRADQITIFDSTGIAVHDLAVAYAIYRQALRRRAGSSVRFFRSDGLTRRRI